MIDINMIYDIWYTQKNKIYFFKSFLLFYYARFYSFYNGMIGNYGQMPNSQVD